MTYINGTIANANPGPVLYTAIETAMLADGWTLVDTVVIGANTHKVLKSDGAGNSQGLSWFLDINFPTTGIVGGMRFAPFEDYNATSHLGIRGPYSQTSTVIDATTYSRYGSTGYALETNWSNTASWSAISIDLTTSSFDYRISVTRDRIVGILTNRPNKIFYTGFFQPSSAHASWAGDALFPIVQTILGTDLTYAFSNSTVGSHYASVTRLPKIPAIVVNGWRYHCGISSRVEALGGSPEGIVGSSVSPFSGRITLKPPTVMFGDGTGVVSTISNTTPYISEVGTIDDMGIGYLVSSSVRGDSLTIGSDTWISASPASNTGLFFKAI